MNSEKLSDIDKVLHYRIVRKWILYDFEIGVMDSKLYLIPEKTMRNYSKK